MNTCESYVALLDAFAEGDLFTEDMVRVQQHLNECPDCQAYLEDLFTIRAAFPNVEDTEVPEGFLNNVMAAVAEHPQVSAAPAVKKKKSHWIQITASLAACCAIVLLLQGGPFGVRKQETAFDVAYTSAAKTSEPVKTEAAVIAEEPAAAAPETEEGFASGGADSHVLEDHTEYAADVKNKVSDTPAAQNERIVSITYQHIMELPAEAAPLLEDFAPADETEDTILYHVYMTDYAIIQSRLADAGIIYTEEDGIDPDTNQSLIILKK